MALEMYNIAPLLGDASLLTFITVIVGFIISLTVFWRLFAGKRVFRVRASGGDSTGVRSLFPELKIVSDWHQLGINLGLQEYELSKIEQDYQGNKRRMQQMLDLWLRRTPNTSWKDLVSALDEMGENGVAERIRKKYIRRETHSIDEDDGTVGIARKNRRRIDAMFASLLTNVCKKLSKKSLDIEDLRTFLTAYFYTSECIPRSSNINEMFEAVTRHKLWDYWNYHPLEEIVQEFAADDQEIKSWIETYKQDLKSYKVTTKLIDHIADSDSSYESPSEEKQLEQPAKYDQRYYRTLSFKLKTKVTDHTLKYIDDLWGKISDLYDLPPRVVILDSIHKGCVSIVWLIPSHLAPKILSAAPHSGDFYRRHEITRVEIDGKCLYQEEEEDTEETETIALPASVVQVAPSMAKDQESAKEGTDQKLKLDQEEMKDQESAKEGTDQKLKLDQEEMKSAKKKISASSSLRPEGGLQLPEVLTQEKPFVGYECEFVNPPPTAFQTECLICKLVLREPYQATCCGTSFCQTCIQRVQDNESSCPNCRAEDFQVFPNKGLKRSLNQLQVYCTHKDDCNWSGELQELEKHLNESYSEETRLFGCKFVKIQCEFHYAGCKVQTARKDMATHTLEQLPYHTKLLTGKMNEQDNLNIIEKLTRSLHYKDVIIHGLLKLQRRDEPVAQPMLRVTQHMHSQPIHHQVDQCFTMEKFQEHKENDSQWYSPPFYTHPRGYKMCLQVDANGYDKASGTHLSLFTCFVKGEFDHELPWPFYGNIVVQLLNQNADDHHHEYIIYYNDSTTDYAGRMRIDTRSRRWGNSHFVSHAKLLKKSDSEVQYLKNDRLKFRVREVHARDSEADLMHSDIVQV